MRILREKTYSTRQKEELLDAIKQLDDSHFTVDELFFRLHQQGCSIGKTTVYRQLENLMQQGIVRKYLIDPNQAACYQYVENEKDCQQHFHLKCVRCGRLLHLDCRELCDISDHVQKEHHFRIDHSKTVFYGICDQCEGAIKE